jgi:hypothetical protein
MNAVEVICLNMRSRVILVNLSWGMRSLARIAALLCLLLTVWTAAAVVAHHHASSAESQTCPVCAVARAVAAIATPSSAQPVFVRLYAVLVEPSPVQHRLPVFALSVRAPPADQGPSTAAVL